MANMWRALNLFAFIPAVSPHEARRMERLSKMREAKREDVEDLKKTLLTCQLWFEVTVFAPLKGFSPIIAKILSVAYY